MVIRIPTHCRAVMVVALMTQMAVACLLYVDHGEWLHPDTAQAISAARNLLEGRGFSTGIVYYEEHYQLGSWPVPQTVFPVGYAALIAALAWLGVPFRAAALAVGVTGFLLVPPLICLAAHRLGRSAMTSVMLAALWLCCPMIWHNVWERQTEMMFVALTLGSLLMLQHPSVSLRQLLLAGCLAAAAFTLRYAGVFWLIAVAAVFVVRAIDRPRQALQQVGTFLAVPALLAVTLFVRNAVLVGDVKGGNNKEINRTLQEAVTTAWHGISRLTGLDKQGLLSASFPELLTAAGLCVLTLIAVVSARRLFGSGLGKHVISGPPGHMAVWSYPLVSLAALICLEKTTSINLSPRMFIPLVPFVLLTAAEAVSGLLRLTPDASLARRRLISAAASLLILGMLGGQFRAAAEVTSHVRRLGRINGIMEQSLLLPEGRVSPRELLQGARILSDEPHMLAEVLEQGVVGLTAETYTVRPWTDAEVVALIRRYRIDRIVVFPDVQPKDANPFFESLLSSGAPAAETRPWLEPLVITPQLRIYAIRQDSQLTSIKRQHDSAESARPSSYPAVRHNCRP